MSGVTAQRPPNQSRVRGAVLVEAAIVLPLALFIIAGILDLGHIFRRGTIIYQASRAGARTAGAMTIQPGADQDFWCIQTQSALPEATSGCVAVLDQDFPASLPDDSWALPLKSGLYMACHYLREAGLNPADWEVTVKGPLPQSEDVTQMRSISVTVHQSQGLSGCLFCLHQQLTALILDETSFFPVQCAS